MQVRHLESEMLREEAPSPFDITHNLTLVTKMQIVRTLSGGLTMRYATGRPITPVVGAVPVVEKSYYLPVEGPCRLRTAAVLSTARWAVELCAFLWLWAPSGLLLGGQQPAQPRQCARL